MDLYYCEASAPCRAVLLTAKALGIELNLKYIDVMAGEHLKPDFVKINPQHTVPTLVDGDFILWESRAIMIYLDEKYSTDDSLYSKVPKERAVINQRLYFDMGTLYENLGNYYYPIFLEKKEADAEKFKEAEKAVDFLNTLLEGKEYAAGDHITLADLSMIASATTFEPAGFDFGKYLNVAKWIKNCKENIVGYEVNQEGIDKMMAMLGGAETTE